MDNVKIDRDGNVLVNGKRVGSVERTTKDTSIMSAIAGVPGPAHWVPRNVDGEALGSAWSRRRDAVNIVVSAAQPTTVTEMTLNTEWGVPLWTATLKIHGHTFMVSRSPDESEWFVYFIAMRGTICPTLSTLPYVRPARTVSAPEAISLLNETAAAAGAEFGKE